MGVIFSKRMLSLKITVHKKLLFCRQKKVSYLDDAENLQDAMHTLFLQVILPFPI